MVCSSRFGNPFTPFACYGTARGWCRGDPSASKPVLTGALGIFAVAVCCLQQRLISCSPIISPSMFSSSLLSLFLPAAWQRRPQPDDNFSALQQLRKIVETVRVQQTQTGEVASIPSCSGVAVSSRTPGTCSAVVQWPDIHGLAHLRSTPGDGFIDHQQVPFGFTEMFQALFLRRAKSSEQITSCSVSNGL